MGKIRVNVVAGWAGLVVYNAETYIQVRSYTADRATCHYYYFLLHGWIPEVAATRCQRCLNMEESWVHFDAKHRQDYRISNSAFAYFNSFPEYAFLRMIEP